MFAVTCITMASRLSSLFCLFEINNCNTIWLVPLFVDDSFWHVISDYVSLPNNDYRNFLLSLLCGLLCLLPNLTFLPRENRVCLSFFRIMRKPLPGIGRAMLFCMGFHWIKVKGKLSSSAEAPILAVAPHSSFIDALALSVICLPSGVSRKENDAIPLIGGLILIVK